MASPCHASSAIFPILPTASHIGKEIGQSTKTEEVTIAPEVLASGDIAENMRSKSHKPRSPPQSRPTYPISIEGRRSSEGGWEPCTACVPEVVVSTPSEPVSEHTETISPERSIKKFSTTFLHDAIEDSNKDIQTQANQSAPKYLREWRPLSLTFGFLLVFILFQATILAAVEVMYHYSGTNTGLATITDHDSTGKTFVWAYLPIIIALLIALAWASISLETARITPWRMLSAREGADTDVLFAKDLRNPFSAPFISLRDLWRNRKIRNHLNSLCSLAVLCSSLAYLVSFLVLPPLQASLLSVKDLRLSEDAKYIQMPAFSASSPILNEDRLGEVYLRAWLSYEGLPIAQSVWITGVPGQQVAVLPISPENPSMQYATFQALTTAYSAALQCTTLNATILLYIDSLKEQQLVGSGQHDAKQNSS
jgi:hypothetical protein